MQKTIAVIGASADRRKYGNRAVRAYVSQGWSVFPVNPHEKKIEGLNVYKSIQDIPVSLDRISVYLPPTIGMTVIEAIAAKKPKELFFNPGSESAQLIQKSESLGLQPILECSITNIGLDAERL